MSDEHNAGENMAMASRRAMLEEIERISKELGCTLEVAAAVYSEERRQDSPLAHFAEVFLRSWYEGNKHTVVQIEKHLAEQKEARRKHYEEGQGGS